MKNLLRYDNPAENWLESMPIGNGRLGAVINGAIYNEVIYLDEESIWSGCPADNDRPDAYKYLKSLRKLIFDGNYNEAKVFAERYLSGHYTNFGTHLRGGSLIIDYEHGNLEISDYRRELDIQNAIASVRYRAGSIAYCREYFASNPDDIVCVRITADKKASVNISLKLASDRQHTVSVKDSKISLVGECEDGGVEFEILAQVAIDGGSLTTDNGVVHITGADEVRLFININSSYKDGDYKSRNLSTAASACGKDYQQLQNTHRMDFSSLFNRVKFELESETFDGLTISKRLSGVHNGVCDWDLITKFFQFGRYLLISSSRENTLAAHLQGIWNDNKASMMGWTCDYHLDINTQMNYWPAEVCNLSECHKPVFSLVESLVEPGRKTAKSHYDCDGWVAHIFTNLWGFTSPGSSERWGFFPTGGLWLALHLAEHYRFTGDLEFLKSKAYPILKEASLFFLSFLVAEPNLGYLVTCPANSEENVFCTDDGQTAGICAGPTCDNVLLRELFKFCLESSQILEVDEGMGDSWRCAMEKIAPFQISKDGRLQEWLYDFAEPEPEHRHISHLLGLYPFEQISIYDTPELAQAAKNVLLKKMSLSGWESVGWNRAWNINLFARLGDGNSALANLKALLNITASSLLTYHPPFGGAEENIFELDGNTGATAGIAEMLLQSGDGYIRILPALPDEWKGGKISGLRARGCFQVDIEWQNGTLKRIKLTSFAGKSCIIVYGNLNTPINTVKGGVYFLDERLNISSNAPKIGYL